MGTKRNHEITIPLKNDRGFILVTCNKFPTVIPLIEGIFTILLNDNVAKKLLSCSITYTSDKEIAVVNNTYKKKDMPTDVLSFPYQDADYLGDIVISLETIALQAKEFSCSFAEEAARISIHGILHLLGFIDTIPTEKEIMWKEQERLVSYCMSNLAQSLKGITLP